MDWSKEKIYQTIVDLIKDKEECSIGELEQKYGDFKKEFPKWYETCLSNEKPENLLDGLSIYLNIREEVKDGTKSEIEANVQVAEYRAKQYLYPVVGEPTIQQKKDALKRILQENK